MIEEKEQATNPAQIIAYKGFDKNFKCRDFQFEIGKTYTQTGKIKACKNGFHACPSPLDVFEHYAPSVNRFAIVELSGATNAESKKIAAECIKVVREINLSEFIECAVTSIKDRATDPHRAPRAKARSHSRPGQNRKQWPVSMVQRLCFCSAMTMATSSRC